MEGFYLAKDIKYMIVGCEASVSRKDQKERKRIGNRQAASLL